MLCRVTNNLPGPRVVYNTLNKPVTIVPKQSVKIDLDEETYETLRAQALVHVGPQIEIIADEPPQPEPPPRPQPPRPPNPQPPQPQAVAESTDEDYGEDVLGLPMGEAASEPESEPPPAPPPRPRRAYKRKKRKLTRRTAPSTLEAE